MTDYIEVPVRVPADLAQEFYPRVEGSYTLLCDKAGASLLIYADSKDWVSEMGRQIAAAVEARKPKPPKFGPGDIVEWVSAIGTQQVGIIKEPAEPLVYWMTDGITRVHEDILKLVRRAEK